MMLRTIASNPHAYKEQVKFLLDLPQMAPAFTFSDTDPAGKSNITNLHNAIIAATQGHHPSELKLIRNFQPKEENGNTSRRFFSLADLCQSGASDVNRKHSTISWKTNEKNDIRFSHNITAVSFKKNGITTTSLYAMTAVPGYTLTREVAIERDDLKEQVVSVQNVWEVCIPGDTVPNLLAQQNSNSANHDSYNLDQLIQLIKIDSNSENQKIAYWLEHLKFLATFILESANPSLGKQTRKKAFYICFPSDNDDLFDSNSERLMCIYLVSFDSGRWTISQRQADGNYTPVDELTIPTTAFESGFYPDLSFSQADSGALRSQSHF